MMLPPIHKHSGIHADTATRRGSSLPHESTDNRSSDASLVDRVVYLERENARFREELLHVRQLISNNSSSQQQDATLIKVGEELQRLAAAFNAKLQADTLQQQREQHKAALLFAEVARLGHRVESLEAAVVADRNNSSSINHGLSDERVEAIQQSTQWLQQSVMQLRGELEADRQARWQREAELRGEAEARVTSATDRVVSRFSVELLRATDATARLHDHVLSLERWLGGEHGKIKRGVGALHSRVASLASECGAEAAAWRALVLQLDDDWRVQWALVHEAVGDVAAHVQRKVFALEEVVPMEVAARQRQHDSLRRRVDGVAKALGRVVESERELSHRRVDPVGAPPVLPVEELRCEWRGEVERRVEEQTQRIMEELTGRHNDLLEKVEAVESEHGDALASLQQWTLAHAHECRQCYAYFQWTVEELRADEIVRDTVATIVDQVAGDREHTAS